MTSRSSLRLLVAMVAMFCVASVVLAAPITPWFAYLQENKDGSESLRVAAFDSLVAPVRARDVAEAASVRSDAATERRFSPPVASPNDRFVAIRLNEVGGPAALVGFVDFFVRVYSMKTGRLLISMNEHTFKELGQAVLPLPELAAFASRHGYPLKSLNYRVKVEGADILAPRFQWNTDGTFEAHYTLYVDATDSDQTRVLGDLGLFLFKRVYALTDSSSSFLGWTSSRSAASPPAFYNRIGLVPYGGKNVVALNSTPVLFTLPSVVLGAAPSPQPRPAIAVAGYVK